MLPPKSVNSAPERRLLDAFRRLSPAERDSLLSYAEFLVSRSDAEPAAEPMAEPRDIQRPSSETVVAAIRRLAETYPMLDREVLLHEASSLMTAHIVRGQPAQQVIDELEVVFRRRYEALKPSSE